ncbi:putative indole-3-pyruvate monooxygenase [Dioscorea sansibarensis]
MKKEVVIVGAGPAGLAVAACLNRFSIPNIIFEKEDCIASLWKKKSYDRLKLHLAKDFCSLPLMPHSKTTPTFIPKDQFIQYLDHYANHFMINPVFCTEVESAKCVINERSHKWVIMTRNKITSEVHEHMSDFLIVATGENSEGITPEVAGLESFAGEVVHSSEYKSGTGFEGKRVLVVGSGNSGMEIAYDLSNFGAMTSISIRSPFHVMSKEMIYLGMVLVKYLPVKVVDALLVMLTRLKYGDLSKYGIVRPKDGPLTIKISTGKSAVIDVGTVHKIKTREIKVVKGLLSVSGNEVLFTDGKSYHFDAIVFATGYKSTANTWLKDGGCLLNEEGLPKQSFPKHWKGMNGVYCAGLARRGLDGVSMDAQNIANDINEQINCS